MGDKKHNKLPSTIWLDFITYIFMLFYIFTLSLNLIGSFNKIDTINIIKMIVFSIFIVFCFFTFYNLIKRKRKAYYCMLYFLLWVCLLSFWILLINIIRKTIYIIELFIVDLICWVIPNYIYIYKRKILFKEHHLINIKRCPGCNRIIPVSMVSCGRCNYKE